MEPEKRPERPNKGKPPAYHHKNYEMQLPAPRNPDTAAASSAAQTTPTAARYSSNGEDDRRSQRSYTTCKSAKTNRSRASVNSTAQRLQLEAELAEKQRLDDLEDELEEEEENLEQEKE